MSSSALGQVPPISRRGPLLALLAAFLGWLFDGFEIGLFPVVARPALLSMLGPGHEGAVGEWMGIITAAFLLGAAGGGVLFGWMGDRVGRVRAMSLSILCYSLFSGAGYLAQEPWHLAVVRFLAAVGMGGEWALGVTLVMEVWPDRHRAWLAGAIGTAANVGMALVGVVAKISPVTQESWRWMFLVGASPAVLTFLIRLFVPESERWHRARTQAAEAGERVRPLREIFQPPLRRRTLLGILLSSVALIGTWGSVQWIPLWADQMTQGVVQGAKSTAHMLSSLGAAVGSLLAPVLLGRISRRVSYFLLCSASLLVCAFLFRTQTDYNPAFLTAVFLTGAATAAFYGWFPLYLPELFPTRVRATGQGLCYNAGRVVAAAGALTSGTLVSHYGGYAAMGAVVTLVYLFGMAVIWFAPETKGLPLAD
ncbi:MAG: naiP [Verrucomicrobiales bacterium]|nr:naiP [Verrucomicrobiales bacterium]